MNFTQLKKELSESVRILLEDAGFLRHTSVEELLESCALYDPDTVLTLMREHFANDEAFVALRKYYQSDTDPVTDEERWKGYADYGYYAGFYSVAYVQHLFWDSARQKDLKTDEIMAQLIQNRFPVRSKLHAISRSMKPHEEYLGYLGEAYWRKVKELFAAVEPFEEAAAVEVGHCGYILGLLAAEGCLSRRRSDEWIMSREEIDTALSKISASTKRFQYNSSPSAMCYSMAMPTYVDCTFVCDDCGKKMAGSVYRGNEDLVKKYRWLADEFMGLAKIKVLCPDCLRHHLPNEKSCHEERRDGDEVTLLFAFTPKGGKTVYSHLNRSYYSDSSHRIALSVLKGAVTISQLIGEHSYEMSPLGYILCIKEILGESLAEDET
ncbi:MAG: hypothetical protein IKC63_06290 [Clostridia bacterium]|nr:hypothetical protein [Clostridia bacterium]